MKVAFQRFMRLKAISPFGDRPSLHSGRSLRVQPPGPGAPGTRGR